MHHAVSAKTVSQEETGHSSNRPKDAMMVGRHLIEPGPGAFGIDRKVLKGSHSIGGVHQDFFDERRFELCLVPGRFFRIVPCKQKATAFRTEMKACTHVDDHRRGMRES